MADKERVSEKDAGSRAVKTAAPGATSDVLADDNADDQQEDVYYVYVSEGEVTVMDGQSRLVSQIVAHAGAAKIGNVRGHQCEVAYKNLCDLCDSLRTIQLPARRTDAKARAVLARIWQSAAG